MNTIPTIKYKRGEHPFDLEERTLKFSREALMFASRLPRTPVLNPVINQFVCSSTSIGANYHEANESNSKKDFVNKIVIAKKEAKETQYWLKLILDIAPSKSEETQILLKETQELNLILASIIKKYSVTY